MGKTRKNVAKKPDPSAAFKKKKIKVGKQLKKTNVTDTRFSHKKVVLLEQLKTAESAAATVSYRGHTLDELCRQTGHFSLPVRRDAVISLRQMLTAHSELIGKHLRTIIPSVGRLIGEDVHDGQLRAQLKALLEQICHIPSDEMSSHFMLLATHVLRGLSHIKVDVRAFALRALLILFKAYPGLCLKSADIFEAFLLLMESQRKPSSKDLLLEATSLFLEVFSATPGEKLWPASDVEVTFETGSFPKIDVIPQRGDPFAFPVLYTAQQTQESPLQTEEGLRRCCSVLGPLANAVAAEQQRRTSPQSQESRRIIGHLRSMATEFAPRTVDADAFLAGTTKSLEPRRTN
ncbi:Protein Y48A6C.4 [Aphelenchoides avenae]|nr:Protein Y48A6C.4 [Aphelenchus avenae]